MIEKQHDIFSIRQVMEMAAPHWEKLSSDEKETYKARSKNSDLDFTEKPQKRKRYNCVGTCIDELQLNLDIEQETYEKMVQDIKDLVMKASDLEGENLMKC